MRYIGGWQDDGRPGPEGGPRRDGRQDDRPPGLDGGSVRGPLVEECELPYQRRSGQVAAVLLYDNGGHTVLWPDRREDHDKPWFRGPTAAFEVLLGRHVTAFRLELPAAGDAEFFSATVRVHWEVRDPHAVVRHHVWDVAELLGDELHAGLLEVSRRFRLDQAQRAHEAVRAELESDRFALGEDLGLRTRVHVFINLSDRVLEQVREGTGVDHRLDLAEREHVLRRRQEQHEAQIIRERTHSFEKMLAGGDLAQIAYFMARDPEKALEIQRLFAQEWREEKADRLELITKLIESGHLERHDISEQMQEVLRHLGSSSSRLVDTSVDLVFPEGPRPRRALEGRDGRRRPFWEEDEDTGTPGRAEAGGAERPQVHEPTSVESSAERDDHIRGGRASDRFDDWEEA